MLLAGRAACVYVCVRFHSAAFLFDRFHPHNKFRTIPGVFQWHQAGEAGTGCRVDNICSIHSTQKDSIRPRCTDATHRAWCVLHASNVPRRDTQCIGCPRSHCVSRRAARPPGTCSRFQYSGWVAGPSRSARPPCSGPPSPFTRFGFAASLVNKHRT